jgi:hypothetical protein
MSARGPHEDERWLRSSLELLARRAPRAYDTPRPMLRRARRRVVAVSVGALLVVGLVTFGGIALGRALMEPPGPPVPVGPSPNATSGKQQTTPPEPTSAPRETVSSEPSSSVAPVPVRCTFEPQALPGLPQPLRRLVADNGSFQLADAGGATASDVWLGGTARGDFAKPAVTTGVVLHWDGTSMTVVAPLDDVSIGAVEALGPDDVWVSTGVGPLHWDGTAWTAAGDPVTAGGADDLALSAAAPDDVWAVGTRPPGRGVRDSTLFAEHFDGTSWTETALPTEYHGPAMALWDVTSTGPTDAWAVGGDDAAETPGPPVVLHWDGVAWRAVQGLPVGDAPSVGTGVSASGPDDVWVAADARGQDAQSISGVVLRWDGARWSAVTPPNPPDTVLHVTALDAEAPNDVWAAGWVFDPESEIVTPIVEHFDGAGWTRLPIGRAPEAPGLVRSIRVIDGEVWAVGFSSLQAAPFVSVCT